MKITWLGHASFRIEIADQVLLLDPWLEGNPVFDDSRTDEVLRGATHILLTHAHFDHASEVAAVAKRTGAPLAGIFDFVSWISEQEGIEGTGFNKGGTVRLGEVAVTMVNAEHSSSFGGPHGPVYGGAEAGFMIAGEGKTLYVAGDTDVMADMGVLAELHRPDFGILPIGGHFTMDAERAAYAAKKFFDFKAVIPCHYKTFGLLAQSADAFVRLMDPVKVHAPEVMGTVEL